MRSLYTFLYIYEDKANAALLQDILKKYATIDLELVKSGEQGIEVARNIKPNIIFIDTHLPKMNGYSVAKILHKDNTFINTPVIAVCETKDDATIEKCLKFGFNKVLKKPITHLEINTIIDKLK